MSGQILQKTLKETRCASNEETSRIAEISWGRVLAAILLEWKMPK